jgi:hypothetical protein
MASMHSILIDIFGSADPGFSEFTVETGDRGTDSTSLLLLVISAMSDFKHTEYVVNKQ